MRAGRWVAVSVASRVASRAVSMVDWWAALKVVLWVSSKAG